MNSKRSNSLLRLGIAVQFLSIGMTVWYLDNFPPYNSPLSEISTITIIGYNAIAAAVFSSTIPKHKKSIRGRLPFYLWLTLTFIILAAMPY